MKRLYDSRRWRNKRARQLAEHPLCKMCWDMRARVTPATVADHIVPHRGDSELFWDGALQSLCASCHSSIKQQMETSGFVKGSKLDGMPLDPNHPWNTPGGINDLREKA